jgi:crotonobetainyl-CoA:carnitine CoA-transferase CaiB-like acyl-CoA transferase
MTEIMEGVRILDFSQEIQGPWGTAILADMGAEVIKIERRETGELSRGAVAKDPALLGLSPYFTVHNRGKKSVTLDLKQPDAVRIVHEIAATSDVVVNNWRSACSNDSALATRNSRRSNPTSSLSPPRLLTPRAPGPPSSAATCSARPPAESWT